MVAARAHLAGVAIPEGAGGGGGGGRSGDAVIGHVVCGNDSWLCFQQQDGINSHRNEHNSL